MLKTCKDRQEQRNPQETVTVKKNLKQYDN